MVDLRYIFSLLSVLIIHSQAQVHSIVHFNRRRVWMFSLLLGATKPNATKSHLMICHYHILSFAYQRACTNYYLLLLIIIVIMMMNSNYLLNIKWV